MKIRQMLRIAFALLVCAMFVGCNTMRGMGRDIERTGEKIQRGANR